MHDSEQEHRGITGCRVTYECTEKQGILHGLRGLCAESGSFQ